MAHSKGQFAVTDRQGTEKFGLFPSVAFKSVYTAVLDMVIVLVLSAVKNNSRKWTN